MPRSSIGVFLRIGDVRQGAVHPLSLPRQRRPIDDRAHERMAKSHPSAELDEARLGRRGRRFDADARPCGRSPHQRRIADRVGRRDKQKAPSLFREHVDASPEAGFDSAR